MKTRGSKRRAMVWLFPILLAFSVVSHVQGQGAFQNLDFESANLTPIPQGQQGSLVPISAGLPGWTGFLGSSQTAQVLHNGFSTGAASIDILGPNFGGGLGGIIDGNFTAVLQAGDQASGDVAATISRNGTVPSSSKALLFDAFADVLGSLRPIPAGHSSRTDRWNSNQLEF